VVDASSPATAADTPIGGSGDSILIGLEVPPPTGSAARPKSVI
jgi:hypothetical protein